MEAAVWRKEDTHLLPQPLRRMSLVMFSRMKPGSNFKGDQVPVKRVKGIRREQACLF
jgi:hypothetical protein